MLRAYHGARAASYARFLDQPHPCGGCGCSQVHSSRRQALARGLHRVYTRLHLLLIVGRATRRRSARLSAAAALSRKRAAAIATTRTPCARAPPPQGASAKEPVTIRQRRDGPNGSGFALFIRGQQLRQIVSRAWHGAHGRLRERVCWSGRTHEKAVGAVKCISRHGKALRSAYGGAQLQLLVIDRRRRQGARRCGDALARTWRLLTPPAGRAHAHAHGGTSPKAPVPIWRCLLEPQRLDTSDPKHASRDEPSLTDRQESVPRRTCGFGSVFIGLAAPTRRL